MRVLVCGGRDYADYDKLCSVLDTLNITEIINGGARGADDLSTRWGHSKKILVEVFEANWKEFGKAAGVIRNKWMLEESQPDLVVAFPGGNGTAHMVRIAKEAGVEVMEID